jgi:GT2 family glycosyltransferase
VNGYRLLDVLQTMGIVADLTSIVILTRNVLECTQACVASIERHTPEPHELIFVDNGSTDGTVEYLRSIDGAIVIENEANLGFSGGCNQGIAVASGSQILLLNNDTVVTPGWLAAMLAVFDREPTIGGVGPRSNNIVDSQQIDDVGYDEDSLDGLDTWAQAWCAEHAGEGSFIPRLVGFCLLLRREVIERIGGFDVAFGIGNFEDDDICMRAKLAGWQLWMCNDSFIHHVGSSSFDANEVDYGASMARNWRHFKTKWGLSGNEIMSGGGGYSPDAVLMRSTFDPQVHYAPLVARDMPDQTVEVDGHESIVLVTADRLRPDLTEGRFEAVLGEIGADDEITVLVRIDPRDDAGMELLEAAANRHDSDLPDIVVAATSDDNDIAAVKASTAVYIGTGDWALAGLAAWCDRPAINRVSSASLQGIMPA